MDTFDIYTDSFVRELSKHKDWKLRTVESRFEKTDRLKFTYRKNPKGKPAIYGNVYISRGGVLHYEVKMYLRIGRRMVKVRPILQDRPLPKDYKSFMRVLRELNHLAPILASPVNYYKGSDGNSMMGLAPKLSMGNLN